MASEIDVAPEEIAVERSVDTSHALYCAVVLTDAVGALPDVVMAGWPDTIVFQVTVPSDQFVVAEYTATVSAVVLVVEPYRRSVAPVTAKPASWDRLNFSNPKRVDDPVAPAFLTITVVAVPKFESALPYWMCESSDGARVMLD